MNWDQAIKSVAPHIVKIETPSGYGTGFLAFYNHDKTWCGIATAAPRCGPCRRVARAGKNNPRGLDNPTVLNSREAHDLARPEH